MRAITPAQQRVLDAVVALSAELGMPPTVREIGARLDGMSVHGVCDHLDALVRKLYLRRNAGSRTIVALQRFDVYDASGRIVGAAVAVERGNEFNQLQRAAS